MINATFCSSQIGLQTSQFAQARQQVGAGLPNGVLGGSAAGAGVRAGGLGGLAMNNPAQLTAIRPTDRTGIGLAGLGAGSVGQQGLGLQGFAQQQSALAAALGGQQATLNLQGMNRLAAAGVGLQQLQNAQRLGLGTNQAVNLIQAGPQPSQDLLSLLSRQQKQVRGQEHERGHIQVHTYGVPPKPS